MTTTFVFAYGRTVPFAITEELMSHPCSSRSWKMGRDFTCAAAMGTTRSIGAPLFRRNSTIRTLFSKAAARKPSVRYSGLRGSESTSSATFARTPDRHACSNSLYKSMVQGGMPGRRYFGSGRDIPAGGIAGGSDRLLLVTVPTLTRIHEDGKRYCSVIDALTKEWFLHVEIGCNGICKIDGVGRRKPPRQFHWPSSLALCTPTPPSNQQIAASISEMPYDFQRSDA